MKLKLEKLDYGTLLSVTESIGPEQVAVLKAGLSRVMGTSSLPLLIDLCALSPAVLRGEKLQSEWLSFRAWAACQDFVVLVAAPFPEFGDALSRAAGLTLLASLPARTAALERVGSAYVEKLARQKNDLKARLQAIEASATAARRLRKINSDLRERIEFTEARIRTLEKQPRSSQSYAESTARLRTTERTLAAVLQRHGFAEVISSA